MQYKNFFISVGEPWDFEGPDGPNVILGEIINVKSPFCVVFKSNKLITFDNLQGSIFILKPRYEKETFLNLSSTKDITVNGHVLSIEYNAQLSEEELMANSVFKIAGGLRK